MEYMVNGRKLTYEAVGKRDWGKDVILLHHAVDLTLLTPWHQNGFTIERLFDEKTFNTFKNQTRKLLIDCWRKVGLNVSDDFQLDQYHTLVDDFNAHLVAIEKTKLLPVEEFPVSIQLLEERVSEICKTPLVARNSYDGLRIFHFRVIRPRQSDNNPLHRDVWLEDYDDCINLYIPIAGSNDRSSLILVPGSHLWPESKIERTVGGAEIKGVRFNVPAVTAIRGSYSVERPDPIDNQVLVFSPYLIHGGAVNLNNDETRISIEIRLWKK
jgi:hypothetical protein